MNKKQETEHQKYVEAVQKLNELQKKAQQRAARVGYLKSKFSTFQIINPEQAEAYAQRINSHKPHIISLIEEIEKQRKLVESMPRVWIA